MGGVSGRRQGGFLTEDETSRRLTGLLLGRWERSAPQRAPAAAAHGSNGRAHAHTWWFSLRRHHSRHSWQCRRRRVSCHSSHITTVRVAYRGAKGTFDWAAVAAAVAAADSATATGSRGRGKAAHAASQDAAATRVPVVTVVRLDGQRRINCRGR